MTAKQKLEALANRWYGYYMITALLSVVSAGFAVSKIIGAAIGLCFSLGLAYFLNSRLQAKSSLTRVVLVIVSGIAAVVGIIGLFGLGKELLLHFSVQTLSAMAISGISTYMSVTSFRTLTDSQVKTYIG